jgi:rhodanese-related sulfurtransferase
MPSIETAASMVEAARHSIESLTVDQAAEEIRGGARLVDVREREERLEDGSIPGAIHAARGLLEFQADPIGPRHRPEFDPDERVIVHSESGNRSALAAQALKRLGYRRVAHLEGGLKAWLAAGYAIVRDP